MTLWNNWTFLSNASERRKKGAEEDNKVCIENEPETMEFYPCLKASPALHTEQRLKYHQKKVANIIKTDVRIA